MAKHNCNVAEEAVVKELSPYTTTVALQQDHKDQAAAIICTKHVYTHQHR